MMTGLAHVCFNVGDLERSIAFYRDKLGLRPAFEFTRATGEKFGQYLHVGGRTFLELFQGGETEPAGERQSYRHLCLEVDDLAATARELRAAGVEVSKVQTGSDRSLQAWLADPDGNRIELHQYTAESKQGPYLEA
jgi:catechol 2,3-dioxygenase-like lactoylglutathione lyase family enzyme